MLSIVTYNLRFPWNGDGINSFMHRAGMIVDKINKEKPDIICFQEGVDKNIDFLQSTLHDYEIVFDQRNTDFGGEGLAVAFRKSKFRLLELSFFWLSPTPYLPGSRFESQSNCPRICQRLTFKRKEDSKLFRVFNTHLDHVSDEARILGIQSVMSYVEEENARMELPFFIMGDLNAEPESRTIAYCNSYAKLPIRDLTCSIPVSYHGFGKEDELCKIDYIFSDVQTASLPYSVRVWDDCYNGIYLSDHYPIALEIDI